MKVLILQTCDGTLYKGFLDASADHMKKYANRHGYDYRRYDGVISGTKAWQATFNRIYLLNEELERNEYDWVCYIDADCAVIDPEKKLEDFFNQDSFIVACRGGTDDPSVHWDINIGVAFYNMRHPCARTILTEWKHRFETISQNAFGTDETFITLKNPFCDQSIMQGILRMLPPAITTVYRGEKMNAFNYDGAFIQQVLRNGSNTVEDRIKELCQVIEKAYGANTITECD